MPMPPNDPSHVAGPRVRLQLTGALDILTAPVELERILVERRQAVDLSSSISAVWSSSTRQESRC